MKGLNMRLVPSSRFRLRSLLVALAIAGSLSAAPPAHAQGTSGALPDPISTRELETYCDRLQMSDQQRQGIGLFHDQYLETFRALREGPIEEYLQEFGASTGFALSTQVDRKEIERSVRERQNLMDRIRTLDNRFLDQLQTVLTEEQTASLQRVKQARERKRLRAGLVRMSMFSNPAANVDLSEIVDELDIAPQAMESVDPVVFQYERNLTTELRELYDGASTIQLDLQDRLSASGFGSRPPRGREDREAFGRAIQTAFSELNKRVQELSADVSELNQRTVRQLTRMVSSDEARELKTRFYDQAYPSVPVGRGEAGGRLDAVERMDDVTDEQHEQIAQVETRFLQTLDVVTDEMVEAVRERGPAVMEFRFSDDESEPDPFREKMDELRERRTVLIDRTINDVNLILGEELTQRLDQRVARRVDNAEAVQGDMVMIAATVDGDMGGGAFMQSITIEASGDLSQFTEETDEDRPDQYLPGPITARELDRYAGYLEIPDDMHAILDGLHEDYLERFDVIRDSKIKQVREKSRALWGLDEETGEVNSPEARDIEELYRLRRSALSEIQTADAAFFNDLEAALLGDDQAASMQRVRFARSRSIYGRGRDTGGFRMFGGPGGGHGGRAFSFISMGGGSSNESVVDLSRLVDDLQLDPVERRPIDPILAEYEKDITAQFQDAFETSLRFDEAMEKIQLASTTQSEGGRRREVRMGAGSMRELMEGDGRRRDEIRASITELNRDTLETLERTLPSASMAMLRDAYNRTSFPDIYNDTGSAEPAIAAAYTLPDLDPNQRMQIDEISTDYRGGYEALCLQMVEHQLSAPSGGPGRGRGFDIQAFQQRQRDMERMQFERKDLSDKARARIKNLLTDPQRDRIGDLLESRDDDGNFIRIGG